MQPNAAMILTSLKDMFNPNFRQANLSYQKFRPTTIPSDRLDRVEACTDTVILASAIDLFPSVMFRVDEL